MHHRRALALLTLTMILAAVLGTLIGSAEHVGPLHGMYCTTGFATTAGCDLTMQTGREYLLGELSMLLMVPLLAAVLSLITAGLTATHAKASEARIIRRMEAKLGHRPAQHTAVMTELRALRNLIAPTEPMPAVTNPPRRIPEPKTAKENQ